jgi:arylsulfatase A-like enzyme
MLRSIACGLLVSFICTAVRAAEPATASRPNILFIAIDDQNDWIGCLKGHPQARTPHIDALAARGTLFTNAHCQAPLCNSSRTSLMMGLRPSTTGIYGLAPWFRTLDAYRDHTTLPQYLSQHGYHTYSTGKIYHGGYGRRKDDREFHVLGPAASVGAKPNKKLVDTPAKHPLVDWGVFPHRDEDKGDWKVASWAVEQLNEKPQEPFFLSVGFFLPHVPCYATQKWFDLYPEDTLELPPVVDDDRDDTPRFSWYLHWRLPEPRLKFLKEANQWKNLVRSYLASVSFVDSQVGRLLFALEKNGLADNTIVVLWSDHGWHLGEKLITGKNTLWEPSTRVPLIFAGPGVAVGATCGQPAELLDVYPTLVELCGLPERKGLEGHSLGPQLRSAQAPRKFPAITTHNADNHAVRSEHWRYICYADGSEELYDLRKDAEEFKNLAVDPKFAEILSEHRRWLPPRSAPPAPGSAHRILTFEKEQPNWEGKDIGEKEPVPEL